MLNGYEDITLEPKDRYKHRFDFLLKAVDDAQNTIRFTDAKAGAVIGFWSILFTLLTKFGGDWLDFFKDINTTGERFVAE